MAATPPHDSRFPRPGWGEPSWDDRAEELSLLDDEDRLPWLDSSDDVAPPARDPVRITAGVLAALALLALVGGGVWWFLNRSDEPVADGGIIAAPEGPYRVRPDDPGGKQHAGTGDTSFAVGEGQRREARLADAPSTPPAPAPAMPAPTASPASSARVAARPATPATAGAAPAPAASERAGVGVQVGAYYSPAAAERGWATLVRQTEALQGVRHRVVQGVADIGTVYRLQAVAPDVASARQLCEALRADGLNCQVKQ
ncbi:SPOR domain-containing protein [Erythrobacteraceae bacterium CFH 75059]|uniref:SPOR domain-containing protein n=1 Tax=Qipengyuania thermophila TaxID=2509361 RepID=UPI00102181F1|nr:SPOR domain-containing protein [Qipengyuania thermophila]TCD06211.1 SPOR domain-containing protein [Erythrobacteraceae bacterium CFH 75059]